MPEISGVDASQFESPIYSHPILPTDLLVKSY